MVELAEKIRAELIQLQQQEAEATLREKDLIDKFNVSRASVREALKKLEAENLIERRRNFGTRLRKPSVKEITDIYDVRAQLEGFACRLAAEHATAAQLAELEKLMLTYAVRVGEKASVSERTALDDDFHSAIMAIAGNPVLEEIVSRFAIFRQAFSLYHKREEVPARHSPYPHEKIFAAIREGRADEAEKLMKEHIGFAKTALIEESRIHLKE